MPDQGEYELLPHEELERLRKEVETLKKDPLSGMGSSKSLIEGMDNLSKSINNILHLFSQVQNDLVREYDGSRPQEKLNRILEQNEKIAKALIAIADMTKQRQDFPSGPPMPRPVPADQFKPYPPRMEMRSSDNRTPPSDMRMPPADRMPDFPSQDLPSPGMPDRMSDFGTGFGSMPSLGPLPPSAQFGSQQGQQMTMPPLSSMPPPPPANLPPPPQKRGLFGARK